MSRRRERIGPSGVLERLDLESLPEIEAEGGRRLLLFRFRDPARAARGGGATPPTPGGSRRRVARVCAGVPRVRASLDDRRRRLPRSRTSRYLQGSPTGARGRAARALVMRSSGGAATLEEAAAHPAWRSSPVPPAGVVGAALVAALAGIENAISLRHGRDVDRRLPDRERECRAERGTHVAGFPIVLPTLDLQTVGAGGGSIVWRDPGGAVRVGPQSAAPIRARPATDAAGRAHRDRCQPAARPPPGGWRATSSSIGPRPS